MENKVLMLNYALMYDKLTLDVVILAKFDALVKSQKSSHSRESGSP